jgi:hypothetical protein
MGEDVRRRLLRRRGLCARARAARRLVTARSAIGLAFSGARCRRRLRARLYAGVHSRRTGSQTSWPLRGCRPMTPCRGWQQSGGKRKRPTPGFDRLPGFSSFICRFISNVNLRCSSGSCFCRADTKALNFSCLSLSAFFAASASFFSCFCWRTCASSSVSSSTTGTEPAAAGTECAAPASPCCAPPTTPPAPAPLPANVTVLFVEEQGAHWQFLNGQFFVCPFFKTSRPWFRHLPHFWAAPVLVADAAGGGALVPEPLAPPAESEVMGRAVGTPASYIGK